MITESIDLADKVDAAVQEQIKALPRREIAVRSWRNFGAIIIVSALADAVKLANRLAAEHLELLVADPLGMARDIRHAGSIFLGPHTPEMIGDYVGGPHHVLPTNRSGRFASGISVYDFMKRSTLLQCGPEAFAKFAAPAAPLAWSYKGDRTSNGKTALAHGRMIPELFANQECRGLVEV